MGAGDGFLVQCVPCAARLIQRSRLAEGGQAALRRTLFNSLERASNEATLPVAGREDMDAVRTFHPGPRGSLPSSSVEFGCVERSSKAMAKKPVGEGSTSVEATVGSTM